MQKYCSMLLQFLASNDLPHLIILSTECLPQYIYLINFIDFFVGLKVVLTLTVQELTLVVRF